MAKFNGKRNKHRNLIESLLNVHFNSAGIGIKGPKPVEKKLPELSHGGPPPHPPQQQTGFLLDQLQRYGQPGYQMNSNMGTTDGQAWMAESSYNLQQAGPNPYYNLTPTQSGLGSQQGQLVPQAPQGNMIPQFNYDPFAQETQVLPQKGGLGMENISKGYVGQEVQQPIAQGQGQPVSQGTPQQSLWDVNAVGTGDFGTISNPAMGGFNTGIGGETGLAGASLNYQAPVYNSPFVKNGNNNPATPAVVPVAKTGLSPAEVAKAQADQAKKAGNMAFAQTAIGTVGNMIAQSDDTTENVRPKSSGRDILGAATTGAAGGMALGPYGALAGAAIGVGTELFASNQAGKQWDEDMLERKEDRQTQTGENAIDYSNYMRETYNSQGGGGFAKYGGSIDKIMKKYNNGGEIDELYANIKLASKMPKYKRRSNLLSKLPTGWAMGMKRKNSINQTASRDAKWDLQLGDQTWDDNVDAEGNLITHTVPIANYDQNFKDNIWKDNSGDTLGGKNYNAGQVIRDLKRLNRNQPVSHAQFPHGGPTHEGPWGGYNSRYEMIQAQKEGVTAATSSSEDKRARIEAERLEAEQERLANETIRNNAQGKRWGEIKDNAKYAYNLVKENPLDALQVGLGSVAVGADTMPGIGNVVSMGADGLNALTSFGRAGYYGLKGDAEKAALYGSLGLLDTAAIMPGAGNIPGATVNASRIARLTKPILETGSHLVHPATQAVTGIKAYDLANKVPNATMAAGGSTNAAEYETEGGEVMLASPADAPVATGQGNYDKIATNLYKAEGPRHEQGGVPTAGATQSFRDASGQIHNAPYVYSDSPDMMMDPTEILKLIA